MVTTIDSTAVVSTTEEFMGGQKGDDYHSGEHCGFIPREDIGTVHNKRDRDACV